MPHPPLLALGPTRLTRAALCLVLLGVALPREGSAQLVVHADQALRGVPPELIGVNVRGWGFTGNSISNWTPCCQAPLALLPAPVALFRIPGGVPASEFHMNGLYGNTDLDAPPDGVDLYNFAIMAEARGGNLIHSLNLNATDQELLNQVEFLNTPAPARPDPSWTPISYRFDAAAPPGYFAWLRAWRGHPAPFGVKYLELGNEEWNSTDEIETRCHNQSACYGKVAAHLSILLKQKDPTLQIGVSIITFNENTAPDFVTEEVLAGFQDAGIAPDFLFDHDYVACGKTLEDAAAAEDSVAWGDILTRVAARNRAKLRAAFPACGDQIGMFEDEFGPQACGDGPDAWENHGPWETGAVAHVYARALHEGFTHASYYGLNGDPSAPEALGYGAVNGTDTVDANFWGIWFASRLVAGMSVEVPITNIPSAVRAYATESDTRLKVLLFNTSATQVKTLSLAVTGRTINGSRIFRSDMSYATVTSVPALRSAVPQTPPAPQAVDLSSVVLVPLSTTLIELDLAPGTTPTAPSVATTGCAGLPVQPPAPDGGAPPAVDAGPAGHPTSDAGTPVEILVPVDAGPPALETGRDAGGSGIVATPAPEGCGCTGTTPMVAGAITLLIGLQLQRRARRPQ